jgi:hypothetical protein
MLWGFSRKITNIFGILILVTKVDLRPQRVEAQCQSQLKMCKMPLFSNLFTKYLMPFDNFHTQLTIEVKVLVPFQNFTL